MGSSADSTSVEAGLVSGTPKQQRSALQRIWDGIAGNSHRQSAPQVVTTPAKPSLPATVSFKARLFISERSTALWYIVVVAWF